MMDLARATAVEQATLLWLGTRTSPIVFIMLGLLPWLCFLAWVLLDALISVPLGIGTEDDGPFLTLSEWDGLTEVVWDVNFALDK